MTSPLLRSAANLTSGRGRSATDRFRLLLVVQGVLGVAVLLVGALGPVG